MTSGTGIERGEGDGTGRAEVESPLEILRLFLSYDLLFLNHVVIFCNI